MIKVLTKFHLKVTEYDASGYYYPKYSTNVIVIAETLKEAESKALERVPRKKSGADWTRRITVLSAEDIVINESEGRE